MNSYIGNLDDTQLAYQIKLVIADDHVIVREGIRSLLERYFRVVGEAEDGLQAVKLVESLKPDILVVDMMMPNLNGLEVVKQVKQRFSTTRTIILSMHDTEAHAAQAVMNGAYGYVLKQASGTELTRAIHAVALGYHYFSPPLCAELIDTYLRKNEETLLNPFATLTSREREIMQLVAEGKTSQQIADILYISVRTVEVHRANIMRKMNFSNSSELVRYAIQHGILT
jgi:DNA-binding NarL/FixJ family response regulator